MSTPRRAGRQDGFTLVELLVSLVLIVLLLIVLVSITDSTRKTWAAANAKSEEFGGARRAFETITRRLSDATLNTYWDYDNATTPTKYIRQSELRFLSGPGVAQIDTAMRPTHAVFFQAPFGFASASLDASAANATPPPNLPQMLNTWGYFIEYASDASLRPAFLATMARPPAARTRFRLMELMEPSEQLSIYTYTSGFDSSNVAKCTTYTGTDWFTNPLTVASPKPRLARPVAENIVALIFLPKLAPNDQAAGSFTDDALAPTYRYDTTGASMTTVANSKLNPTNQLPPIVQVTMIALDEVSYSRFSPDTGSTATMPDLFSTCPFTKASDYATDLQTLQKVLTAKRLGYRAFTTNISIKSAKWSTN